MHAGRARVSVGLSSVGAMRERILAVVGAVGLVVAAIVVRSMLVGDDGSGGGNASGGNGNGALPVVACDPDLADVCDALAADGSITRAPSALSLADAAEPPPEVDAWITWDPAPGIANFDAPGTWTNREFVAGAPLAVLVADGPGACDAGAGWDCVVTLAEGGGSIGVGDGTSAQSLARLHPVARALVPDDGDFTDISALDLRRVIDSPQVRQDDMADQVTTFLTRRGALSAVVGPRPALDDASSNQTSAAVADPEPATQIAVVLATRSGADRPTVDAADLVAGDAARSAFEDLGLTTGSGSVAAETVAGGLYSVRQKVG